MAGGWSNAGGRSRAGARVLGDHGAVCLGEVERASDLDTHQQTASRMRVSKSTVDTFIARIRAKLGVGNKAELTAFAILRQRVDRA